MCKCSRHSPKGQGGPSRLGTRPCKCKPLREGPISLTCTNKVPCRLLGDGGLAHQLSCFNRAVRHDLALRFCAFGLTRLGNSAAETGPMFATRGRRSSLHDSLHSLCPTEQAIIRSVHRIVIVRYERHQIKRACQSASCSIQNLRRLTEIILKFEIMAERVFKSDSWLLPRATTMLAWLGERLDRRCRLEPRLCPSLLADSAMLP